ncbi:HD domain-containing phosphohydrolase [Uliginosibacterium sp. H3]|uniref:HD domain-containing phosphohydrolase n=1 Tax=Uliginosibacterium silvisoli TaxID=3114758 RepID=A0ABU6K9P7_9RHOO|nr:HD domain-containing phosphohydrolase [Uliginosibacterium sp. H3]
MTAALPTIPAQANRHFLQAVVDLSAKQEIALSEDIYNDKGVKILAAGARVSADVYAKVISHKLVKPIEVCISTGEPPSGAMLVRIAEEVLDELPLLAGICNWSQGRVTPVDMLSTCKMSEAAGTLLAVSFSRTESAARHAVTTALIAMGIANAYRYNDSQLMSAMCLGGLFHDVGELYIDPAVLDARKLTPSEWMSYASHPIIGAALAREVCGFDTMTQRAILEHHEYADGFGYPRSLRGQAISTAGRVLSLAEVLSALVQKPAAFSRIDIALKIMPGEHEPELVSLVNDLLRLERGAAREKIVAPQDDVHASVHSVLLRIADVLGIYDELMSPSAATTQTVRVVVDEVFDRFAEVQKAFASTGVGHLAMLDGKLDSDELQESRFEAECVFNEIAWRLQKLSRELVLKAGKMRDDDAQALLRMAGALSGTPSVDQTSTEMNHVALEPS